MFDFSTRMSGEQPVRMVLPQVAPPTDSRVILRRLWRGSGFIVLGGLFMVAVAVEASGLSAVTIVPLNSEKWPRTLLTIMCLITKPR